MDEGRRSGDMVVISRKLEMVNDVVRSRGGGDVT